MDIDDLVAAFAAGEDANLTLFTYVTEVGGGGRAWACMCVRVCMQCVRLQNQAIEI
jgi:hypothetical protein